MLLTLFNRSHKLTVKWVDILSYQKNHIFFKKFWFFHFFLASCYHLNKKWKKNLIPRTAAISWYFPPLPSKKWKVFYPNILSFWWYDIHYVWITPVSKRVSAWPSDHLLSLHSGSPGFITTTATGWISSLLHRV